MRYEWKLPDVGEGIHEAEIVRWHVKPGDVVAQDQTILEIQTDKAVVDIPSPVAGTVTDIRVPEGEVVRVGTVLIVFESEATGPVVEASSSAVPPSPPVAPPSVAGSPHSSSATGRRALATPAVRKLARDLGVDIQGIRGSGPNGRVMAEDVRQAATAARTPAAPPAATVSVPAGSLDEEERVPLRGTRRVIAEHMVRSKFTAPHVTTMDEVEVSQLVSWRRQMLPIAQQQGVKLTYLPFIIKATVAALKKFPYLNASLDDERREIVLKKRYHIGLAVDDPEGLLVPVIRDADQKSLLDLAREIQTLTEKAHAHQLAPQELAGSTFTITNYGSFGGLFATPVINYPEVAILGTGRIQKKAWVDESDQIQVRPLMGIILTFDHRVIDGGMAGRFLNQVMQYLHEPHSLFLEMN